MREFRERQKETESFVRGGGVRQLTEIEAQRSRERGQLTRDRDSERESER